MSLNWLPRGLCKICVLTIRIIYLHSAKLLHRLAHSEGASRLSHECLGQIGAPEVDADIRG